MAKLKIGSITTEIKLPEIRDTKPESEEIPKVAENVEIAILEQNELREKVEKLEKHKCNCDQEVLDKIQENSENLILLAKSFDEDLTRIENRLDKVSNRQYEVVEKPNVEMRTITVDKTKEIKEDINLMEDSIRLSVNGLFSNLDNKIDKEIKNLKNINKLLIIGMIIISLIAIIK